MGKWEMVRFDDVVTIINGKNQEKVKNPQGAYPIYGSGGIMGFADDYICEKNTVIVGRKGTINKPIYVAKRFWNVDTAFGIKAQEDKLYPKFLYYFCTNFDFEKLNTTVTIPSLTKANLLKIQIPLPPLPIQQKIADILDRASALIEKRKAQIEKLDLLVKSQFVEMFGDPVTNTKIWEFGTIRDLVSDVKYGTSKPAEEPGKYIYLRMNNITYDGQLDFSNIKYINVEDQELEKYVVRKGDLLFNRTNSKELVGKTAVFREKSPMIIAGYIIRVRTNQKAHAEFLSGFLNSKYGKQLLFDMCKAIIGQANINAQELQDIKIYIPPLPLQNEFAVFVERVEAQKARIRKSLALLELNYKSLMQKCFQGEIF